MTAAHTAPSAVVTPVVDYEPRITTDDSAPAAVIAHPVTPRLRIVAPPSAARTHPDSTVGRDAAAFADFALRVVLEVIDRRRQPSQLHPLMVSGLADSVVALGRSGPKPRAAAVLRRARVQPCATNQSAFEVAASYTRDARLHAIACRIELRSTAAEQRWQLVALHIG